MKLAHLKRELFFYICVISAVVALFAVVSHYGESNLRAVSSIQGVYQLTLSTAASEATPITPCLNPIGSQPQTTWLVVQQSGVFLNGSLLRLPNLSETSPGTLDPTTNPKTAIAPIAKVRPTLTGTWNPDQLQLHGVLNPQQICSAPVSALQSSGQLQVKLSARHAPEKITGEIAVEPPTLGKVEFVGQWVTDPWKPAVLTKSGH